MKKLLEVLSRSVLAVFLLNSVIVYAAPQFTDSFESGDLSNSENGVMYGGSTNASVSSVRKLSGNYSLSFLFKQKPTGEDSFAEQRMKFPKTNELWIEYDLYIPSNYYHRSDGASNNKFLAIYRDEYRYPGFQVNWSLSPSGSGGSHIALHQYRNGREIGIVTPSIGRDFITAADKGSWVHIAATVKVPSSESATDGVMQMWKNGTLVTNETALNNYGGDGENYTDELYLLGWANSGFSEDTILYIDNLKVNNAPFESDFAAQPNPPSNISVH